MTLFDVESLQPPGYTSGCMFVPRFLQSSLFLTIVFLFLRNVAFAEIPVTQFPQAEDSCASTMIALGYLRMMDSSIPTYFLDLKDGDRLRVAIEFVGANKQERMAAFAFVSKELKRSGLDLEEPHRIQGQITIEASIVEVTNHVQARAVLQSLGTRAVKYLRYWGGEFAPRS